MCTSRIVSVRPVAEIAAGGQFRLLFGRQAPGGCPTRRAATSYPCPLRAVPGSRPVPGFGAATSPSRDRRPPARPRRRTPAQAARGPNAVCAEAFSASAALGAGLRRWCGWTGLRRRWCGGGGGGAAVDAGGVGGFGGRGSARRPVVGIAPDHLRRLPALSRVETRGCCRLSSTARMYVGRDLLQPVQMARRQRVADERDGVDQARARRSAATTGRCARTRSRTPGPSPGCRVRRRTLDRGGTGRAARSRRSPRRPG